MRSLLTLLSIVVAAPALSDGVKLPAAERLVLENGAVVILSEKHDVPLIGMEVVVRGGAVADPIAKYGLANLVAGLIEKGAGERDAEAFADAAARVGGNISAAASLEAIGVSAEFMARDAALMVELVADMLQRPTLANAEFEKLRGRYINLIKAAKGANPDNLLPSYANAFLFGEHPYGNPITGSESSLANLSLGDVRAYYADQMGADRMVIAVSGDFDAAEMRALLERSFSAWRPAAGEPPEIPVPASTRGTRVYLIDKPGATQSYFYIGNTGVGRAFSGRAALDLANTVFGGRFTSMLMTELRTKSGLSYGARSIVSKHAISGSTFISSFTATNTTVEAIDVALRTLGRLRDSGLSEEMTASARNYVMGQFPTRFETAGQIAGTYAELESQGLDASHIDDYGGNLAAATPESIAEVVEDVYPDANNLVFVVLGDASIIREQVANYGPVTEISISEPRFHP